MANPTSQWDKVPIFGWYMELDGSTPKVGQIKLTLGQRVNTQSSFHTTFPGGTVTATIGDTTRTDLVNQIRAAMSAVDQAAVEAAGGTFDAAAWGAVWDAKLPSAFFTDFPASDDPDIIGQGYEVKVEEKLTSGDGKIYYITPTLSDLLKPIPGVNLGEVDVPPGSPTAPAPIYQKGVPGGVASLDETGLVPLEQLPANIGSGGVSSWNDLQDKPVVIAAGDTQDAARVAIDAADTESVAAKYTKPSTGIPKTDLDSATQTSLGKADTALQSVTKATVGLGNVDNTADANKPVSTAQAAALAVKADLVSGTVPASQLPSYVDDVLEFATATAFPQTGESGKIYLALNGTGPVAQWRWTGTTYAQMFSSPGSTDAVPEGTVNKYFTDARAQAAVAPALATRFVNRGAWVNGGVYAVNDVVSSGGAYFYALIAHTSANPAPTVTTPTSYWGVLSTNVAIGTQAGQAADAAATAASLALKATKSLLPQFRFWDPGARTWTAADTTAPSRICISTNDTTAATPDSYGPAGTDLWWEATA